LKGFATACCYTLAFALDIPDKAIAFSTYVSYWPSAPDKPYLWVFIFIIIPVLANGFPVRGLGEAEFYLTSLKIAAILGISILGFIIAAGGTDASSLLDTNNNKQPIFCESNQSDCLTSPGFGCIHLLLLFSCLL